MNRWVFRVLVLLIVNQLTVSEVLSQSSVGINDDGYYFGDSNLDGEVNFSDFLILSSNFGMLGGQLTWADGDFDGDGLVEFSDFLKLSSNFGKKLTYWHRVFVTSTKYAFSDFGGVSPGVGRANADYQCTFAAFDAGYIPDWDGLRIDYNAFMSDGNAPIVHARDRFVIKGAVINTNGDTVWPDADAFPAANFNNYNYDEYGFIATGTEFFWTGSDGAGFLSSNCGNWTNSSALSNTGSWGGTGTVGDAGGASCSSGSLPFLCISNALLLDLRMESAFSLQVGPEVDSQDNDFWGGDTVDPMALTFGQTASYMTSIPEPSGLSLLLLGVTTAGRLRGRRSKR